MTKITLKKHTHKQTHTNKQTNTHTTQSSKQNKS